MSNNIELVIDDNEVKKFIPYPSFKSYYHEHVCDNAAAQVALTPNSYWVATEKIHGANLSMWTDGKTSQWNSRNTPLTKESYKKFYRSDIVIDKYENKLMKLPSILGQPWVQIYGEICGGKFNNKADANIACVQKEVEYTPSVEFVVFDIMTTNGFVPIQELIKVCDEIKVHHTTILMYGTLYELLKLNSCFESQVYKLFNLGDCQPQQPNNAEGFMLRPNVDPGGKHLIIKYKNPLFSEHTKKQIRTVFPNININIKNKNICQFTIYDDYININRANAVRSKIGPGENDMKFIGMIVSDAINDILVDYPDAKKEQKKISKHLFNLAKKQFFEK